MQDFQRPEGGGGPHPPPPLVTDLVIEGTIATDPEPFVKKSQLYAYKFKRPCPSHVQHCTNA